MHEIEVRRSVHRKRSISARREGGKTVILMPAHLTQVEEDRHIASLLDRLDRKDKSTSMGDADLERRAAELSRRYLDGAAEPSSVRWVTNQNTRWGSCSTNEATIRLSHRLQAMPLWVIETVLVHELAHLIEPNHSATFWSLVDRYPQAQRAKGFLEGVAHSQQ